MMPMRSGWQIFWAWFVALLVGVVVACGATAFIAYDVNPASWTAIGRAACIFTVIAWFGLITTLAHKASSYEE